MTDYHNAKYGKKLEHAIDIIKSPIGHIVRCDCGWSQMVPKQNALARAAKVRSAIRRHIKQTEAE